MDFGNRTDLNRDPTALRTEHLSDPDGMGRLEAASLSRVPDPLHQTVRLSAREQGISVGFEGGAASLTS